MAHSTRKTVASKPHKDFPLTPRGDGRWCKKINGKLRYFRGSAAEALEEWLRVKDDLLAGRTPRPIGANGVSVGYLVSRFLAFKEPRIATREISQRTFDYYYHVGEVVVSVFGKNTPVGLLRTDDFERLRNHMAERWGPVRLGNMIGVVRSIFLYANDAEIIERPIKFGPGFKKPSAKVLRLVKRERGEQMFLPSELRAVLAKATINGKAMTLLGINAAMGNTDLALMPIKAVNLKTKWLNYARSKTGIHRRIPLWPETVAAIGEAISQGNEPKSSSDTGLVFIGKRGENYIGNGRGYRVHQEFARMLKAAGVSGRTFYDLRRTFQTVAEGTHDLAAVKSIMGHAPPGSDMSSVYRQKIEDARLCRVTDYMRQWLFGDQK